MPFRSVEKLTLVRDEDARKDDIVEALENHLQKNATRLSRNASFEPYYGTRKTPSKARLSGTTVGVTSDESEAKSVVKGRGRRPTAVKQEFGCDCIRPTN